MEDPNDPPIFASKSNKIISWNIKGNPAEDIRVHDTKFYCTENRGLIRIKNKKISFDYILFFLKEHLVKLGGFLREDEAHAGKVKSIKVNLPTDKKGEIDLEKQNQICQSYKVVNEIKQELKKKIRNLDDSISKIDLFK